MKRKVSVLKELVFSKLQAKTAYRFMQTCLLGGMGLFCVGDYFGIHTVDFWSCLAA